MRYALSHSKSRVVVSVAVGFAPAICFSAFADMAQYGHGFWIKFYFLYAGIFGILADFLYRSDLLVYSTNTIIRVAVLLGFVGWGLKDRSLWVLVVNFFVSLVFTISGLLFMLSAGQ